jgi:hypothetical protein
VGFELTTLVVIGTDGKGSCKSNYQTRLTSVLVLGTSVLLLSTSDGALFAGIRPPDGGDVSIPASSLPFILSTNININVVIGTDGKGSCKSNYQTRRLSTILYW